MKKKKNDLDDLEISNDQRIFEPNLPSYYNIDGSEKPALTYFVNILYSSEFDQNDIFQNLEILNVNVSSMPNGQLIDTYQNDMIAPGGNIDPKKVRFKMFNNNEVLKFNLIENNPNRVRKIFEDVNLINQTEMSSKRPFLKFLSLIN